jgi:hypothetical protein
MRAKKIDLENFPTSQSAQNMLATVTPGFYDQSYVGKWLYQVMGLEFDEAERLITEELPLQFFPETATWGLMYHELKWGLPVRDYLSYDERRKLIYEKRDQRAPMTPYRIETMLANVTGFWANIADIHDGGKYGYKVSHPNTFIAVFVGDGSLNTKAVKRLLDSAKQSHTTYTIIDRMDTVLDCTTLEQMLLRNINIKAAVPFWRAALLDGSGYLDGSMLLDSMREYDLILGLMYRQGEFYTPQSIDLSRMMIWLQYGVTEQYTGLKSRQEMAVYFWPALRLDGSVHLDGSETLDWSRQDWPAAIKYRLGQLFTQNEAIIRRLRIPLKTELSEDYACGRVEYDGEVHFWTTLKLDGSAKLDGSELLDKSRQPWPVSAAVASTTPRISEEMEDVTLITRKDLAYLNGSLRLDGTRILDSEYHKEAI